MKLIYQHYQYGPFSHDALRNLYRIFDKSLMPKLVLCYHPLFVYRRHVYECISKVDGELMDYCGTKVVSLPKLDYMGINAIVPLVSLATTPIVLIYIFKLTSNCLCKRPENQLQARNSQFFKYLTEALLRISNEIIVPEIVDILSEILYSVVPQLRDDMLVQFMWSLELWSATSLSVQEKLFSVMLNVYTSNPKLTKEISVSQILDGMIQYYDHRDHSCCDIHNKGEHRASNLQSYIKDIVYILEICILHDKNVPNIRYIISALFQKTTPCIQVQLINLIKRLLLSKEGSSIRKQFLAHNGLEWLLFLIANSGIDIRSLALAWVDILLASKPKLVIGTEKDIVSYLSSILITKKQKHEAETVKARAFSIISQPEAMEIEHDNTPPRPVAKKIDFNPFSEEEESSPEQEYVPNRQSPAMQQNLDIMMDIEAEKAYLDAANEYGWTSKRQFGDTRKSTPTISLNTSHINDEFPIGGAPVQTEEEALFESAVEIATNCIKYMNGELTYSEDERLYPRPPILLSPQSDQSNSDECESDHSDEISTSAVKAEEDEESIYITILEMVLKRSLHNSTLLDDSDILQNHSILSLIFYLTSNASENLRQKILQDLVMLTKWNSQNAVVLSQNSQWLYWLLDLLMNSNNDSPVGLMVADMGSRLNTLVLKEIMTSDDDSWRFIKKMINWIDIVKQKKRENSKNLVWELLDNLYESLKGYSAGSRPSLSTTFWRNIITMSQLIEELLVYTTTFPDATEETFIPEWLDSALAFDTICDMKLLDSYFELLDPIWPKGIFDSSSEEDFTQLAKLVSTQPGDQFKQDITLLLYDPGLELKGRGPCIKSIVVILCLALRQSGVFYEKWLQIMIRVVKFLLLISETNRKILTNFGAKTFASSIQFLISFMFNYMCDISSSDNSEKYVRIRSAVTNILAWLFNLYLEQNRTQDTRKSLNFRNLPVLPASVTPVIHEVVTSILNYDPEYPLIELAELTSMRNAGFSDLNMILENIEWQDALRNCCMKFFDSFISVSRAKFIWSSRKAEQEKCVKEIQEDNDYRDEVSRKLQNSILQIAAEQSDLEDQRRNSLIIKKEERQRQRRQFFAKQRKALTGLKGIWATSETVPKQTCMYTDSESGRPLLIRRSEDAAHNLCSEVRDAKMMEDPTQYLNAVASANAIKLERMPSSGEIEDDDDESAPSTAEGEWEFINPNTFKGNFRTKSDSSLISVYSQEGSLVSRECAMITTMSTRAGMLQILQQKQRNLLRFVLDEDTGSKFQSHIELFNYQPSSQRSFCKEWDLATVYNILPRRYILRQTALEFFFENYGSVLFNFTNVKDREVFLAAVRKLRRLTIFNMLSITKPNLHRYVKRSGVTERWMHWEISNFEYLMFLNQASGRSYHDLTQYPVFPWILKDYKSNSIDLENPKIYRDLSKSMGALGPPHRIETFRERFKYADPLSGIPPFHFGSHYSSPGSTLQYLIRLFPFTEGAKALQGGHFDIPDRLFYSIPGAYRLATEDISDVREMIPEFYFLPEILINQDNLDFGTTQLGIRVDGVDLPPWANNAYDFVYYMRKALEHDFVSANIHHWIDLIFGYKQKGEEAEINLNTFYYMTYEDSVDLDKIEDEGMRISAEAQVVNFGQTPSQLFIRPHPQRLQREEVSPGASITSTESNLRVFRPNRNEDPHPHPDTLFNYMDIHSRSIIRAKFIAENKILGVRISGQIVVYKFRSVPQADQKSPFSCSIEKEKTLPTDFQSTIIQTRDRSILGFNAPIRIVHGGRLLVQGGYWDGRLSIQKINESDPPVCYWHHSTTITALDDDYEERVLVTGSKDGECIVWVFENDTYTKLWHFYDHDDEVTSVCISNELNVFASCSLDGTCNIYSLRNGELFSHIRHGDNNPLYNVIISSAAPAKLVLHSEDEKQILLYSINGGLIATASENHGPMINVLIAKDLYRQDTLIYGTKYGDVIFRDLRKLDIIKRHPITPQVPVTSILISRDQRFLLVGCQQGDLFVVTDPASVLSLIEKQWGISSALKLVQDKNDSNNLNGSRLIKKMSGESTNISQNSADQEESDPQVVQAIQLIEAQSYEAAKDVLERVVQINANDGRSWARLGHCFLKMSEYQKSLSAYQNALYATTNIQCPQLWYDIGLIYDKFNLYEYAEPAFQSVLNIDANFAHKQDVYLRLGNIYLGTKNYVNAIKYFENSAAELEPTSPDYFELYEKLGDCYAHNDSPSQALSAYSKIVSAAPDNFSLRQKYVICMLDQDESLDELKTLQSQAKSRQEIADTKYLLSRRYYIKGNYGKSIKLIESALQIKAACPTYWFALGVYQASAMQIDLSFTSFTRALGFDKSLTDILYNVGLLYEKCDQNAAAIKAYDKLLEQVEDHEQAKARKENIANKTDESECLEFLMPKLSIVEGVSTPTPETTEPSEKLKLPELKSPAVPQAQSYPGMMAAQGKVPPGMQYVAAANPMGMQQGQFMIMPNFMFNPNQPGGVPQGAIPAGAIPAGAIPAGAVPTAIPAGSLRAGAVPAGAMTAGKRPETRVNPQQVAMMSPAMQAAISAQAGVPQGMILQPGATAAKAGVPQGIMMQPPSAGAQTRVPQGIMMQPGATAAPVAVMEQKPSQPAGMVRPVAKPAPQKPDSTPQRPTQEENQDEIAAQLLTSLTRSPNSSFKKHRNSNDNN